MNHPIDIRRVGEICRHIWWTLAGSLPDDEPFAVCRGIVHDLTQHWDGSGVLQTGIIVLTHQYWRSPASPLTLEELVSLHEHGDIEHTIGVHTEDLEVAELVQTEAFDLVEVVRWATVYFFGASPTIKALVNADNWKDWISFVFISGQSASGVKLLDCCVIQGASAAVGKPTKNMTDIIKRFSACSLQPEQDSTEPIYY